MLTVNRRPGPPIDQGISVIVDLPHVTELPARPHLCSIMRADTHDPVTGVLGVSMHFDCSPSAGNYELWLVAEQLVDEKGDQLPLGHKLQPELHHEYFSQALRTGLFRYRVAGFTAGSVFDQTSTWHRDLGESTQQPVIEPKTATNLTEFEVTFKNLFSTRVEAHYFEYAKGFVTFYAHGFRAAGYNAAEVIGVRTIPEKRVLVVDDEQLRVLRSAVLWDAERTATSAEPSEYRGHLLDVLTKVLGMTRPSEAPVNECAAAAQPPEDDADAEADAPNERTQRAARRLDELVKRA
jgi:hypothetical protein